MGRERSCHLLKIETQDINVPDGLELGAVNRFFYQPPYADEVQFVWYLRLRKEAWPSISRGEVEEP